MVIVWIKGNQDFSIGWSNGPAIIVGIIDTTGGQADVIHNALQFFCWNSAPDQFFHVITQRGRFLDAGTSSGTDVETHLASIHFGEKVLAQKWHQQARSQTEAK